MRDAVRVAAVQASPVELNREATIRHIANEGSQTGVGPAGS